MFTKGIDTATSDIVIDLAVNTLFNLINPHDATTKAKVKKIIKADPILIDRNYDVLENLADNDLCFKASYAIYENKGNTFTLELITDQKQVKQWIDMEYNIKADTKRIYPSHNNFNITSCFMDSKEYNNIQTPVISREVIGLFIDSRGIA